MSMKMIFEIGIAANGNVVDTDTTETVELNYPKKQEISEFRYFPNGCEIVGAKNGIIAWKIFYSVYKSKRGAYTRCEKKVIITTKSREVSFTKVPDNDNESVFWDFFCKEEN